MTALGPDITDHSAHGSVSLNSKRLKLGIALTYARIAGAYMSLVLHYCTHTLQAVFCPQIYMWHNMSIRQSRFHLFNYVNSCEKPLKAIQLIYCRQII